jgi:hydrogenase nickel incorporation protein HypA/HybF
MHEMGIALEIYRVCREAAQAHGGGRIERVRMEVGELAAVEPDLLKFAWEAATTGGPDAGAILEISWFAAAQNCANCGEEKRHSEGSWLRICPDCGMPLEVTGGDQLDVIDVTLVSDEGQRDDAVAEEAG